MEVMVIKLNEFYLGHEFEAQVSSMMDDILTMITNAAVYFYSLGTTMVAASGFQSGIRYQWVEIKNKTILRQYSPGPPTSDSCACSTALNCPDKMWSGGQFICQYDNNCTIGTTIWSIPGLKKSCTSLSSIFESDLRCFFDQNCVDTILSLYNVGMPDRFPLSNTTMAIKALNSSIKSRFSPNTTILSMMEQMMIEEWLTTSNFEGYYESCSPSECTYKIARRLDITNMISTIVGFFGGLMTILGLIIPISASVTHRFIIDLKNHYYNSRNQTITTGNYTIVCLFVKIYSETRFLHNYEF